MFYLILKKEALLTTPNAYRNAANSSAVQISNFLHKSLIIHIVEEL